MSFFQWFGDVWYDSNGKPPKLFPVRERVIRDRDTTLAHLLDRRRGQAICISRFGENWETIDYKDERCLG